MSNIKLVDVTKSGNPVIITDGAEQAHKVKVSTSANSEVILTGKNVIPYPYANSSNYTLHGVNYKDNGDGTITIKGKPTGYSMYFIRNSSNQLTNSVIDGVTYSLSLTVIENNGEALPTINSQIDKVSGGVLKYLVNGDTFTVDKTQYNYSYLRVQATDTTKYYDCTIGIQLELGDSVTEFETLNQQIATVDSNGICYFNSIYPTMIFTNCNDSNLTVTYRKTVEGGNEDSDNDESLKNAEIYKYRMCNYYPQVIQNILEFQAIIDSEYPEIDRLHTAANDVLSDAYLQTMSEDRISQWEQILGIRPVNNSTLEDRRETIIARIRGQGKLNSEMINKIVSTFTGGTANSYVKDGVLYVEITPPPNNKSFKFENVEQELKHKVPAHLGLSVSRNYYTWKEIRENYNTWSDLSTGFNNWEEVLLFIQ